MTLPGRDPPLLCIEDAMPEGTLMSLGLFHIIFPLVAFHEAERSGAVIGACAEVVWIAAVTIQIDCAQSRCVECLVSGYGLRYDRPPGPRVACY